MNRITGAFVLLCIGAFTIESAQSKKKIKLTRNPEPATLFFQKEEMLYIGNCQQRDELQNMYHEELPLNEPFVALTVKMKGNQSHKYHQLPGWFHLNHTDNCVYWNSYFPYSKVKYYIEGHPAFLSLKNGGISLVPQQLGTNFCNTKRFETVLATAYYKFCHQPNYVLGIENESENSLLAAQVIEKKRGWTGEYSVHGPQGDLVAYYRSRGSFLSYLYFRWWLAVRYIPDGNVSGNSD